MTRMVPTLLTLLRLPLAVAFVCVATRADVAVEIAARADETGLLDRPALTGRSLTPILVALLACTTDFVDGRLARHWSSASSFGAKLDVVADGVFVVTAFLCLASDGWVPWGLPLATMLALLAFLRSKAFAALGVAPASGDGAVDRSQGVVQDRPGVRASGMRRGADRAGHVAGVANFAVVVAAAAGMAAPEFATPQLVYRLAGVVAILNLAPILLRVRPRSGVS